MLNWFLRPPFRRNILLFTSRFSPLLSLLSFLLLSLLSSFFLLSFFFFLLSFFFLSFFFLLLLSSTFFLSFFLSSTSSSSFFIFWSFFLSYRHRLQRGQSIRDVIFPTCCSSWIGQKHRIPWRSIPPDLVKFALTAG